MNVVVMRRRVPHADPELIAWMSCRPTIDAKIEGEDPNGDILERLAAAAARSAVSARISGASAPRVEAQASAVATTLDATADPWLGGGCFSFPSFTPLGLSDLHLRCADWVSSVIGCTSIWIHPDCSSSNDSSNEESSVVMAADSSAGGPSRCQDSGTSRTPELQQLALLNEGFATAAASTASKQQQQHQGDDDEEEHLLDPWEQWSFLQQTVGVSIHLGVALQLTEDLPSELVLQRWLAEPLRCVLIPTSIFMQLQQQPDVTLLRQHLTFLLRCAELRVRLVLIDDREAEAETATSTPKSEAEAAATAAGVGALQSKRAVVEHKDLLSNSGITNSSNNEQSFQMLPPLPPSLLFSRGHRNTLQIPMQPLADDLNACSYEVFERDATKYRLYSQAIYRRLIDLLGLDDIHQEQQQAQRRGKPNPYGITTALNNPNCLYISEANFPLLQRQQRQRQRQSSRQSNGIRTAAAKSEAAASDAAPLIGDSPQYKTAMGRFSCLAFLKDVRFGSEAEYLGYRPPAEMHARLRAAARAIRAAEAAAIRPSTLTSSPALDQQQQEVQEGSDDWPRIAVYVVGAGRGPLVQAALDALRKVGVPPCFYFVAAIEKNPQALYALMDRQQHDACAAWRQVAVVAGDIRKPETAAAVARAAARAAAIGKGAVTAAPLPPAGSARCDIMVSELLGSLGDNELSPECIDGAQQLLLKAEGISIPAAYVSSLEPVSCPLLHAAAAAAYGDTHQLDAMFVVYPHGIFRPSREGPRSCFAFQHPNPLVAPFATSAAAKRMHAFTEYILGTPAAETTAEGDAAAPAANAEAERCGVDFASPFCLSSTAVTTGAAGAQGDPSDRQELVLAITRKSDNHRVWFERAVMSPVATPIQNLNGVCYFMGNLSTRAFRLPVICLMLCILSLRVVRLAVSPTVRAAAPSEEGDQEVLR
ncbi:hypothetical protein cyc_01099 [Cyclospora cayetanensis]|uniref:Protein arginine N-methyltransferase n=1 Tax=Cyclospora cayetanensis TaxID=88456 RepID=A0A1D3CS54_9EIME|nr:hypothetical protein cyc_01099 [Cyclospora cayetanensis]